MEVRHVVAEVEEQDLQLQVLHEDVGEQEQLVQQELSQLLDELDELEESPEEVPVDPEVRHREEELGQEDVRTVDAEVQ